MKAVAVTALLALLVSVPLILKFSRRRPAKAGAGWRSRERDSDMLYDIDDCMF